jgi:hypothetical protein
MDEIEALTSAQKGDKVDLTYLSSFIENLNEFGL